MVRGHLGQKTPCCHIIRQMDVSVVSSDVESLTLELLVSTSADLINFPFAPADSLMETDRDSGVLGLFHACSTLVDASACCLIDAKNSGERGRSLVAGWLWSTNIRCP
jgi:hypothetical protein